MSRQPNVGVLQGPHLDRLDAGLAEGDVLQPVDALGAFGGEVDVEAQDREEQVAKGIVGGVACRHHGHEDQAAEHEGDFGEDHALLVAKGIADGERQQFGQKADLGHQAVEQRGLGPQAIVADRLAHRDARAGPERGKAGQDGGDQGDHHLRLNGER